MSSVEECREWASRITYKPGVYIQVCEHHKNFVAVRLAYRVSDSTGVLEKVDIEFLEVYPITAFPCFDAFLGILRRQIHKLEAHEADEWIQVDAVKVFDPHKGDHR